MKFRVAAQMREWGKLGPVLLIAIALALPWLVSLAAQEVLVGVAIFCLLALGLNVVVGLAGLLDLGYVAFYATGAYSWAILSGAGPIKFGFTQTHFWGEWGFWVVLVAAIGINMLIGIMLGSPTLRLRGDYLAIVTLGFGEIVRIVANNLDPITRGAQGIQGIPHPKIPIVGYDFGLTPANYYYLLLVLIAVVFVVIRNLQDSRIGRAWVAMREDEVAAQAMGVATFRMKLLAFAFGASTAGFAGVVVAAKTNYISPSSFDVFFSFLILVAVVLGGMGNLYGAVLGAFILAGVPGLVQLRYPGLDQYRYLVFGAVLVIMMIFRPQGLIPARRRALGRSNGQIVTPAPAAPAEGAM
jgi:branched-chain amino acid transport system permease protein